MVLLHHYHLYLPIPRSLTDSRFNLEPPSHLYRFSIPHIEPPPCKLASFIKSPLLIPRFKEQVFCLSSSSSHIVNSSDDEFSKRSKTEKTREGTKNNFWGAVSLIIGTAVGPGMLGLPAATIKSGSFPSTIAILLCWVYVISSIILVAELSFSAMHEDGIAEVSFIGLATKALGTRFAALVAVVYASLSFSLLVACFSGIGSIVSQWFPSMNRVLAHALFPTTVGVVIGFFPFRVIDTANRFLCSLMVASITALVGIGLSVTRASVLGSFGHTSWNISLILPAIPVTVLTLGFHVITPFICKIAGDTISKARKAILIGGTVPLIMVLSWNLIVLGLAGSNRAASSSDPISLLLSVNPSALSAVQGFAFSALATSSIGYAVSFPKQLLDTLELISKQNNVDKSISSRSPNFSDIHRTGRVGCVTFSDRSDHSNAGMASFNKFWHSPAAEAKAQSSTLETNSSDQKFVMILVLSVPILIGSFFPSTFSRALDFAGVYANCFLFGILPPAMAYVQKSRKKLRSSVLPGGNVTLLLLFAIAVILAIWH